MELGVFDRLILLNILPREGDFTTIKIVRRLREDLSFSEEEHAVLQFQRDGATMHWKREGEVSKDVQIGEKATDVIVATLKKLSAEKKLTEQHLVVYEKFIKE